MGDKLAVFGHVAGDLAIVRHLYGCAVRDFVHTLESDQFTWNLYPASMVRAGIEGVRLGLPDGIGG